MPAGVSSVLSITERCPAELGCNAMIGRLTQRVTITSSLMRRSVAGCGALVLIGVGAYSGMFQPPSGGSGGAPAAAAASSHAAATSFRQIILPDLLIVSPAGLSSQQLTRLNKISGVRNMIAFDGAEIKAGGRPGSGIGVNPPQFRAWGPRRPAPAQPLWTALASGEFAAATTARKSLGLRAGASYPLTGASTQLVRFGGAASLGIEGVDLLVDSKLS